MELSSGCVTDWLVMSIIITSASGRTVPVVKELSLPFNFMSVSKIGQHVNQPYTYGRLLNLCYKGLFIADVLDHQQST